MSFDWKSLVGTVAPGIAATFGTPLMGMGVRALCDALGMTPAAKEEDTHAALEARLATASPADLLAIKNSEQEFQKNMKSLDIDLEKIQAGDRDSARKMQVDTRSKIPAYMAVLITAGFFGVLVGLMAGWLHTGDSNAIAPVPPARRFAARQIAQTERQALGLPLPAGAVAYYFS